MQCDGPYVRSWLHPQGLLTTWDSRTDPCDDGWHFVSCNCNQTFPQINTLECAAAEGDTGNRRVLMLMLGNVITTKGRQLYGPLSPGLGNLTELRTLAMHDNHLSVWHPQALRPSLHSLPMAKHTPKAERPLNRHTLIFLGAMLA